MQSISKVWISKVKESNCGSLVQLLCMTLKSSIQIQNETGHLWVGPDWGSFHCSHSAALEAPGNRRFQTYPWIPAYFDSGKWKVRNLSGLLFTLTWSDQWRESKRVYFVFHSSLVVKQLNRKQIPLTHKYPKHKADQSSSRFCSHGIESSIKDRYSPSVGSRSRSAWWGEMADRVPFLHIVTTIKRQSISLTFKASGHWKF